ncbi:reverse transcriptase [Hordeum vulgare]|nr:reverse transcriptase [Hordeum vulgare]
MAGSQENLGRQDGDIGLSRKLLERLTLQEDEADDLIWEEELDAEEIKSKWLALGRLLTTKTYSHSALIADMRAAWNPTLKVTWRRIDANLFSIQFNCLGDWNKAIHQGPWDFKGYALILAEYDGFTNPEKVRLDKIETWAQIHKLPDGVLKSEKVVGNLAQRIGEVQEVQVTLLNGFVGEFIRVRVKLDVNKKITRVVGITKGGCNGEVLGEI